MRGFEVGVVVRGHGFVSCYGRAHRGLPGDTTAAGAIVLHPKRQRRAAAAAEDGGKPAICDMSIELERMAFEANRRREPLRDERACRTRRP